MNLYELSDTYKNFLDLVEAGEIPDEAIADTLESLAGDLEEKADNTACAIKGYLAEATAMEAEAKVLKDRAESKKRRAEALKNYLSGALLSAGITKMETARNAMSFRKSTSVYIHDEEDFKQRHPELVKTEVKVTIPKSEIAKLLKDGTEIYGAELRSNQNLQIK